MKEAPLVEHLEELRARILWSLLAGAVGTGVAWTFRVQLLEWLKRPLDLAAKAHGIQVNLIVLDITEPFLVSLKVAAFGGLVLALPFIVYQVWAFIAPGLYEHEKRLADELDAAGGRHAERHAAGQGGPGRHLHLVDATLL